MSIQKEFEKIVQLLGQTRSHDPSISQFGSERVRQLIHQHCHSDFKERIEEEILGCGPIKTLIHQPLVTEIIINGKDNIFYEMQGIFYHHNDQFFSKWTFENFVHELSKESRITPTIQNPYADGKWKNFRVHIITSPLTESSYHITLRSHSKQLWNLDRLLKNKWATTQEINILQNILKKKMNILIAGPTSSGKTTVLNALLQSLNPNERVISIEDTDEIVLPNTFSVKLLTRKTHTLPSIDSSHLVQQSLRMRPDRIVMGEVRGAEAKDLVMALATGHEGSIGTIHAHDHKQALLRLELLAQSSKLGWKSEAIQKLIYLSIQIIIIVQIEKNQRFLQGIYQLTGLETTGFLFDPLFQRNTQLRQTLLTHGRRSLRHRTSSL